MMHINLTEMPGHTAVGSDLCNGHVILYNNIVVNLGMNDKKATMIDKKKMAAHGVYTILRAVNFV